MEGLDPVDVEIGRRVHDARKRAGLSQRELGERIGLTAQQVQKYEAGHSRMAVSTLCRIAGELDVAPAALISGLLGEELGVGGELSERERELIEAYRAIGSSRHRDAVVALAGSLSAPRS